MGVVAIRANDVTSAVNPVCGSVSCAREIDVREYSSAVEKTMETIAIEIFTNNPPSVVDPEHGSVVCSRDVDPCEVLASVETKPLD